MATNIWEAAADDKSAPLEPYRMSIRVVSRAWLASPRHGATASRRQRGGADPRATIGGRQEYRMNRWLDWWEQSLRDLRHALHAIEDEDFEWSAFAAQQAAEKALNALVMAHGGEPWGHLTTALVEGLPASLDSSSEVLDAARRLDKHYIPARYPNGFAAGYPGKLYTRGEAAHAIADATLITDYSRRHLPRSR